MTSDDASSVATEAAPGADQRAEGGAGRDAPLLHETVLDVFDLASLSACQPALLAEAIARDESLAADTLAAANSARYNPSGREVRDLETAVERLGPKRAGDLALATRALAALMPAAGPGFDARLVWRRCVAAGVAVDLLLSEGGHAEAEEGLFLNALLHPLRSLALCARYPRQYREMFLRCRQQGLILSEEEARVFPAGHRGAVGRVLRSWGLPSALWEPLEHVADACESLEDLPEPLRTKVELLKLGATVAEVVVGEWQPWDRVDVPPPYVVKRSRCRDLGGLVRRAGKQLAGVAAFWPRVLGARPDVDRSPGAEPAAELDYCNLSPAPFDFLAEIVPGAGVRLRPCAPDGARPGKGLLLNCLWASPRDLAGVLGPTDGATRLFITDFTHAGACARLGRTLVLPASFQSLRDACLA